MEQITEAKSARMLTIYARFLSGQTMSKAALAAEFGVTERSIQRDMEALRCFFAEQGVPQEVIYDRQVHGYRLVNSIPKGLNNSEILAVCKILLESRSMRRDEMLPILDKLIDCAVPEENKRAVTDLIANEKFHYIEPHHGQHILDGLWEIGQAVQQHRVIEIEYERMKEPKLLKDLDIAGLIVLMKRITTDQKFIQNVKAEYVLGGFNKMTQGDPLNLKATP